MVKISNGQVVTTLGRKIALHRLFDAVPAFSAPNFFKVGTGTNTPAVGDTALQTPILIGGFPTKAVVTGYPIFDDANLNVTNRALLLTTEGNGNNISEFGLVNSDGTPQLFSRAVFTAIAKTLSVQIIFIEKDQIS